MDAAYPRLLVVADADDAGARQVTEVVRARHGPGATVWLVPASLGRGVVWEHRVREGRAVTHLTLPDGRRLADPPAGAVLNRIGWLHVPGIVGQVDRDYAMMELHALLLSWLQGLGSRVVNPPHRDGLAGPRLPPLELLARLGRHGVATRTVLATTEVRGTRAASRGLERRMQGRPSPPAVPSAPAVPAGARTDRGGAAATEEDGTDRWSPIATDARRVLVAGPNLVDAPAGTRELCQQVARVLGCPIVAVDLVVEPDRGWVVAGAETRPALTGAEEVRAVADLLDAVADGDLAPAGHRSASGEGPR